MHDNKTLFDLDGRVALVTGGSRGLGLQIAEALGIDPFALFDLARAEADAKPTIAA